MFVAVDAGDRSAEIDQIPQSHDMLTLVLYTCTHSLKRIQTEKEKIGEKGKQ